MPVVADSDEPPAKCCKFCNESTHSVDGSESWRLTLDQDLIDTLKGSFPNWFATDNSANVNNNNNSNNSNNNNNINNNNNNNNNNTTTNNNLIHSTSSSASSSASSSPSLSLENLSNSNNLLSENPVLSPTTTTTTFLLPTTYNGLFAEITTDDRTYQEFLLAEHFDAMDENLRNPSESTEPTLVELSDENVVGYDSRESPPKSVVDSSPLQPQMDKNKESLKVKLMVRRPITQLVEQGIIPPLKTSPAIHEQCKQLERAKTGDLLKAKIQQRPNRQELERRHILEHDEGHVDPSLAEKQRMLKKARLADQLNSQISHRPGPLELIKKNILHTEKPIERIVKEGLVTFKATSEGLLTRPQHPQSYVTFDEDSQSSESDTRLTPPRQSDVLEAAAASAGIVTVALTIPTSGGQVLVTSPILQKIPQATPTLVPTTIPPPPPLPPITPISSVFSQKPPEVVKVKQDTSNLFAELCQSVAGPSSSPGLLPLISSPASLGSSASTLSPLSSVASPPHSITPRPVIPSPALSQHIQPLPLLKSDAPGKDKNRKKSKSKPTVSKARTIKFHEYKGPPNSAAAASGVPKLTPNQDGSESEETSYQLMLEQQNCLLKFLENLNKNQSIIPSNITNALKNQSTAIVSTTSTNTNSNNNNAIVTSTVDINIPSVQSQIISTTQTQPLPLPSPALSQSSSIPPPSPAPSFAESTSSTSEINKLEKMKVSDLKLQLKKRNLPVSGPKPQLIERLKPYLPLESSEAFVCSSMIQDDEMGMNSPQTSIYPDSPSHQIQESMDVAIDSPCASIQSANEDLVREQQRRIDELQRQLQKSQQELEQIKQSKQQIVVVEQPIQQQHVVVATAIPPPPPPVPQAINQKLVVKQQLEAKIQKQKLAQQQNQQQQQHQQQQQQQQQHQQQQHQQQQQQQVLQHQTQQNVPQVIQQTNRLQPQLLLHTKPTPTLIIPQSHLQKDDKQQTTILTTNQIPLATKQNNLGFVWNNENQTLFLVGLPPPLGTQQNLDNKPKNITIIGTPNHHRTASLPSILVPITSQQTSTVQQPSRTSIEHLIDTKPVHVELKPPPPLYEEVIQQKQQQLQQQQQQQQQQQRIPQLITKFKEEPMDVSNSSKVKSPLIKTENLNDVLDIFIKNGEITHNVVNANTTSGAVIRNNLIFTNNDNTTCNLPHQQLTQRNLSQLNNQTTDQGRQKQICGDKEDEPKQHNKLQPALQQHQHHLFIKNPTSGIENIDMSSPMHPTCNEDDNDVVQSLNSFLDEQTMQQLNHEISSTSTNHGDALNNFDDLELLELMSQQLGMDIGDETCNNFSTQMITESMHHQQHHHNPLQQQQHQQTKSSRRDMNPSLQPSISELIQQQHNNNNRQKCTNNFIDTTFDSVASNNNFLNNSSTTPMDVCDDYNLGFTEFSPSSQNHDSNINTPPHPFSTGLSNNSNDILLDSIDDLSNNICGNSSSISTTSASGNSGQQQYSTADTAYNNHLQSINSDVLDLFNIDDFKMSWGEVDFAV